MKKMRLHIGILLGLFLVTFILGSIFDQQLSEAIFRKDDNFGLTVSCIGTLLGYSCLALCGGVLFGLAFTREYKIIYKVLIYIGAAIGFGLGIFFAGREFFGPNGFTNESIEWLGYVISLPFMCGAAFLGYTAAKKNDSKYLLNVVIIMMVAIFLALVPGVTLLKSIFHRPRFRTLSDPLFTEITFHNWWQPCKNYMELRELYGLESDHFKSYPSGHSGEISILIVAATFFPLADKKFEKYQMPAFYIACGCVAITMFARILAAAHFLSDVSWGMSIIVFLTFITNEILMRVKAVQPKE